MKCEKVMETFMELDQYTDIPLRLRLHFFICPKCRDEAACLIKELAGLQGADSFDMDCSLVDFIMNDINFAGREYPGRISALKWVMVGTIIFTSIVLVNYSNSYIWLKENFGADIILPMSLVLGVLFTIYFVVLMCVNYSGVMKGIENIRFFKKD